MPAIEQVRRMNPTTGTGSATEAVQFLETLATAMATQGWTATIETPAGRLPALYVRNPNVPVLSEHIYAWPSTKGTWFYWWSWGQAIAPTATPALAKAVGIIANVLRPNGASNE
jgi:hypothetical protein